MSLTWGEIRTQTINLGFEKAKSYEKNKQSYIDAYNQAVELICIVSGDLIDNIEISKEKKENCTVYDLKREAEKQNVNFLSLAQSGVYDCTTHEKLNNIVFSDNRFLTLPIGYSGKAVVNFYKSAEKITVSSPDETVCPLSEKWAALVPYYMANRLYSDDDVQKAVYYWNLAEDMKNQILAAENMPFVTVNENVHSDWW